MVLTLLAGKSILPRVSTLGRLATLVIQISLMIQALLMTIFCSLISIKKKEITLILTESLHSSQNLMPEREGKGPEGGPRSAAGALDESSQLPVAGSYDYGALKTSLLRGRLSDDDKYKVLKHLDQPLQFKFPPVMEGKQLRRFQTCWFSKYPWLTYSRSENGGYCAYRLAF